MQTTPEQTTTGPTPDRILAIESTLDRILTIVADMSERNKERDRRTEEMFTAFAEHRADTAKEITRLHTDTANRNEQMTDKLASNTEEITKLRADTAERNEDMTREMSELRVEVAKQHTDATKESKNNLIATVVVVALATAVTNLIINFTI